MTFVIRRGRNGIPHVTADRDEDLFVGQGYATAQDRLWQLEYDRRRANGRLAEVTGRADHAVADAFARRARLAEASRRGYDALDEETRVVVDAHVDGINRWLDELSAARDTSGAIGADRAIGVDRGLPAMFKRLGAPAPEPWQPWEAVAVFVIRHVTFATWQTKLWWARVFAALGADAVPLFRHEGSVLHTPVIVPPGVREATGALVAAGLFDAAAPAVGALAPLGLSLSGSNAWVVHGTRTTTGLPLIAGDPHRPFEAPNVYYQIRLTGPGFDAAGFSFPGVPGIPHFGQGVATAWGVTNAMADYQDLYVERLPEAVVDVRHETVAVRDAEPLPVECALTRHGPIVVGSSGHHVGVALASSGLVEAGRSLRAILPQLRAGSVSELDEAMRWWTEPANNFVLADAAGHIGYRVGGLIPVRSAINSWLPVPGWVEDHDWTGYVPDEELPRAQDPAVGAIVTANQRVVTRESRWQLGVDPAPPYRAERIWSRLEQGDRVSGSDMAAIHADAVSLPALRLAALAGGALHDWDGDMRVSSVQAALAAQMRHELVLMLVDRLPRSLIVNPFSAWEPPATASPVEQRVARAIDGWIAAEDRTFLEPGETWGSLVAEALQRAERALAARTWGDLHHYTPVVLGTGDRLDLGPVDGAINCVMAMNQISGVTTNATTGSTARYVWDLADRTRSGWVVPMGVAGHWDDEHGVDQLELWKRGELLPVFEP